MGRNVGCVLFISFGRGKERGIEREEANIRRREGAYLETFMLVISGSKWKHRL